MNVVFLLALRLMTYNVNYANPDLETTLDAIAKADADVVVLQEVDARWEKALEKRFKTQYAHQIYRLHTRGPGGLAVLSKDDITTEETLLSPYKGWFFSDRLVIDSPLGALQILNVHLRPAIDNGSWIKGFFTTRSIRLREIKSYWKKIAHDVPTIIAGDFNEDPTGNAVAFLENKGLKRADLTGPETWHYVRGKTDALKLNIDHVMVDEHLTTKDGEVLDAGTSDHRPVVVTIDAR